MIKETSLASVIAAGLTGAGLWGILDHSVFPPIAENKEAVSLAQNKSDTGNLVTTKLVEDRIEELEKQKAQTSDPAKKAQLQNRIDDFKRKLELLEQQILK